MQPDLIRYIPKKAIVAIVSLITLFITIVITISVVTPLLQQSTITPISSSVDPHFSEIDLTQVETSLKTLLENSYYLSPDKVANAKATIREDTITYTLDDKDKVINAKFIIDVSEPKLTYQVDDQIDLFVSLTCPSIEFVQDPSVFCIGYGGQSTIDANLGQYLPYTGTTTNNIEYTIWQDLDDDGRPRLDMFADICDDATIADAVETSIRDWISAHGIPNPYIIPLNLQYSYCSEKME